MYINERFLNNICILYIVRANYRYLIIILNKQMSTYYNIDDRCGTLLILLITYVTVMSHIKSQNTSRAPKIFTEYLLQFYSF